MMDFRKDKKEDKKFVYILNLNKMRIALLSGSSFVLVFLVFMLGFSLGAFTINSQNPVGEFLDLKKEAKTDEVDHTAKELVDSTSKDGKVITEEIAETDDNGAEDGTSTEAKDPDAPQQYTRIMRPGAKKKTSYFIQVLSTQDKNSVESHSKHIRQAGYRTFTKQTNNGFVLSVGIFASAKEATNALKDLQEKTKHYGDAFVKLGYVQR